MRKWCRCLSYLRPMWSHRECCRIRSSRNVDRIRHCWYRYRRWVRETIQGRKCLCRSPISHRAKTRHEHGQEEIISAVRFHGSLTESRPFYSSSLYRGCSRLTYEGETRIARPPRMQSERKCSVQNRGTVLPQAFLLDPADLLVRRQDLKIRD